VKPFGRALTDFPNLSPAERVLINNCRLGARTYFSSIRPKSRERDNFVRAEVLRFLALGGDEQAPVHEAGILISGAWIEGELSLEGVTVSISLSLRNCHFEQPLILRSAQFSGDLEFDNTYFPGIRGDGLTCMRDLFLRGGTASNDLVRLVGATVHGDFDLTGAKLRGIGQESLMLDGIDVKGSLHFGPHFVADGPIRLSAAHIGRRLDCRGATFKGSFTKGKPNRAVNMRGATIDGVLDVRGVRLEHVVLADASARFLEDDVDSWLADVVLNGFQYQGLAHDSPTDCISRLGWLHKQSPAHLGETEAARLFCPQPWQQLIRTLRAMGHKADAVEVGIAFEDQLRRIGKVGESPEGTGPLQRKLVRAVSASTHWIFGLLAGYGYKPMRLLIWMFAVWGVCALTYWGAARHSLMGPSNPAIFDKDAYAMCSSKSEVGSHNWYLCSMLKSEFPSFSPLAYSLDILLPVVNLRQEDNWTPIVPSPKGDVWSDATAWTTAHSIRLVIWFETIFGWIASLLLVATVSGFARRNE